MKIYCAICRQWISTFTDMQTVQPVAGIKVVLLCEPCFMKVSWEEDYIQRRVNSARGTELQSLPNGE